jgi:cytochrome c oxidase subunit IV
MLDRVLSRRTFLLVDAALLLLALTSIGLARIDLHGWNAVSALTIAAIKAVLIALFFMELRFVSAALPRLVAIAALLWLAILLFGTLDDVLTRGWLATPGK